MPALAIAPIAISARASWPQACLYPTVGSDRSSRFYQVGAPHRAAGNPHHTPEPRGDRWWRHPPGRGCRVVAAGRRWVLWGSRSFPTAIGRRGPRDEHARPGPAGGGPRAGKPARSTEHGSRVAQPGRPAWERPRPGMRRTGPGPSHRPGRGSPRRLSARLLRVHGRSGTVQVRRDSRPVEPIPVDASRPNPTGGGQAVRVSRPPQSHTRPSYAIELVPGGFT